MKRKNLAIFLMMVMLLSIVCPALPVKAEPEKKVIRIALSGDEGTTDPATGTTNNSQQLVTAAYVGLFHFDEENKLQNDLCKDWSMSEDGLTYTFTLRDDAKWSDGQAITAEDFVYGWQRNLSPKLKPAYADLLNAIENFEACMLGEKDVSEFGVKAKDENTLVVTLSRTQPYFHMMTTFSPFFPLRKDKVDFDAASWSVQNMKDIVVSGAFRFVDYVPNEKVILEKNPAYYDAENVKLDGLEYYFIPDAQTQVSAFKTDEIDIANFVPMDINESYANKNEILLIPYLIANSYVISGRQPALADVRVRKAINLAISREEIAEILGGTNKPIYGLIPPGIPNPATGKDFREEGGHLIVEDVQEAQKLMEEAGYPMGEGFPTLVWLINNSQTHNDVSQAIQSMLKDNIGVNIEIRSVDTATFGQDRREGKFDICRCGTSADYLDPTTWLNLYMSTDSWMSRVAGYSTPEYDAIMAETDKILDPAERFEKLHQAEKLMIDDAWWIPLLTFDMQVLVKEKIKNIRTTTAGAVFLNYADIVE